MESVETEKPKTCFKERFPRTLHRLLNFSVPFMVHAVWYP
nr:MAG TPA: hypothetical protein [Caudoviricetes sp.]